MDFAPPGDSPTEKVHQRLDSEESYRGLSVPHTNSSQLLRNNSSSSFYSSSQFASTNGWAIRRVTVDGALRTFYVHEQEKKVVWHADSVKRGIDEAARSRQLTQKVDQLHKEWFDLTVRLEALRQEENNLRSRALREDPKEMGDMYQLHEQVQYMTKLINLTRSEKSGRELLLQEEVACVEEIFQLLIVEEKEVVDRLEYDISTRTQQELPTLRGLYEKYHNMQEHHGKVLRINDVLQKKITLLREEYDRNALNQSWDIQRLGQLLCCTCQNLKVDSGRRK